MCANLPCVAQSPLAAPGYQLVFSDEFNTLDLGTEEDGSAQNPHTWYEGVWFSKQHTPRSHFSVENSVLCLLWQRGQSQPDSTISTFTRNNPHYHAWRYGYFETRMKWSPVAGEWPAVWLIPVQAARGGTPQESGEIDIFEGQGTEPHTFFGTIHRWKGSQQLESSSAHNHFRLPAQTNFSEFHTYGLLWVPGKVNWYSTACRFIRKPPTAFSPARFFSVGRYEEGSDWKSGDLTDVTSAENDAHRHWIRDWSYRKIIVKNGVES